MTPALPFRHPWLLALPVLLLYLGHYWLRSAQLVRLGRLSPEERRKFATGLIGVVGGSFAATSVLQSACASADLFCLLSLPPRSTCAAVFWMFHLGAAALLLAWVWRGGGDGLLAKVAPALGRGATLRLQVSAADVRRVVVVIVVLSLVGVAAIQIGVLGQTGLAEPCPSASGSQAR